MATGLRSSMPGPLLDFEWPQSILTIVLRLMHQQVAAAQASEKQLERQK